MNSAQLTTIQKTWLKLDPSLARSFYRSLFAMEPGLRSMFGDDIEAQAAKLHRMLSTAVAGLRKREALRGPLRTLGRRHRGYGVTRDQYELVGAALLYTLAERLGADWTVEVAQAWAAVYAFVANEMLAEMPGADTSPVSALSIAERLYRGDAVRVASACRICGVSKSTLYRHLSRVGATYRSARSSARRRAA